MKRASITMLALAVCALVTPAALAQRGVGESEGVARKTVLPKTVTLEGTVVKVETGPCENTTGRAFTGTHFLLENSKGKTLNVHLGPAGIVDFVAKELTKGKKVKVEAFRTEQMKENHYVARAITCDGRAVTLRNASLQPAWAGGAGMAADARGWPAGSPGRGAGPGWGRGYGRGRGAGWGRGQGGGGYRAGAGQCPRFGAWYPVEEPEPKTN
ncbi:MAG: hypothetical protein GXX96_13035 [Planctomycetaceae bacterium]|nr:hypothetical protein [Planctomycetaceae bacterium]